MIVQHVYSFTESVWLENEQAVNCLHHNLFGLTDNNKYHNYYTLTNVFKKNFFVSMWIVL